MGHTFLDKVGKKGDFSKQRSVDNKKCEVAISDPNILHIMSSASSPRDLKDSFRFCLLSTIHRALPTGFGGYTPLNKCMVIGKSIIDRFRAATKVQIVNAVFLTDGEANDNALSGTNRSWHGGVGGIIVLRDCKREWSSGNSNANDTSVLVDWLRSQSGVKCIGVFVGSLQSVRSYVPKDKAFDWVKAEAQFKKNGWVGVPALGFDEYFVMSSNLGSSLGTDIGSQIKGNTWMTASDALQEALKSRNAGRGMVRRFATMISC